MADTEPKKEGGGGGGASKLLPIMLGLNSLLLVGVLALVFIVFRGQSALKAAPAAPPAEAGAHGAAKEEKGGHGEKGKEPAKGDMPGPTVKLPDFVVHLRDAESDRYARLTVEVEVADDKAKDQLQARMPHVRDAFIAYLSDRTTADLRGGESIARAKVELAELLKKTAPSVSLKGLFITDLVVQ